MRPGTAGGQRTAPEGDVGSGSARRKGGTAGPLGSGSGSGPAAAHLRAPPPPRPCLEQASGDRGVVTWPSAAANQRRPCRPAARGPLLRAASAWQRAAAGRAASTERGARREPGASRPVRHRSGAASRARRPDRSPRFPARGRQVGLRGRRSPPSGGRGNGSARPCSFVARFAREPFDCD